MITNIDEIKQAARTLDIVSEFVKLKKQGSDYVGLCPFHNEKTPSFKIPSSKDFYKCFGCGKSGDSFQFLMDHSNMNYIEAVKYVANYYEIQVQQSDAITYERPIPRLEKLSPDTIKYFESRGISNNTLLRFNITETIEWMPGAATEIRAICFNYFKDDELVNIKYRAKNKDFKMSKNAEPVFYNIDSLKGEKECVIVEGEIDCLSLYEAGIYNVVSVPNGAAVKNESSHQLKYLDNCWQYFENMETITIMTDNDGPGKMLSDELARRLGREKCVKITYPEDCKDANDILIKHGKIALANVMQNIKRWPIDGLLTIEDFYYDVLNFYKNGYPKGADAGIPGFDELLTFVGGQITIVTGAPNSGKSEFLDLITTSLARRHNWKFTLCSFENPTAIHITKLMQKFIGKAFDFRKDPDNRMTMQDFEDASAMVYQYFSFININQVEASIQGLLNKLREVVLRTGIKGVVLDPWNHIEHKVPAGQSETQYISEVLSLLREFAANNDVHIFIVAHPKKMQINTNTGKMPVVTMYDISGSAHFFNKADNGFSVYRDYQKNITDVYVQKVRFEWLGKLGFCSFNYDTFKRKYTQL